MEDHAVTGSATWRSDMARVSGLLLFLFAFTLLSSTAHAVQNEEVDGAVQSNTPDSGANTGAATTPVATDDAATLVCSVPGTSRFVSYEVSTSTPGAVCEKVGSNQNAAVNCHVPLSSGGKRFLASANCKDGCSGGRTGQAQCSASGKGAVQ